MGICNNRKEKKEYLSIIGAKGIFDNKYENAFPQTKVANVIRDHFCNSEKLPKALIVGFDGARADSMACVVKSCDENVTGDNNDSLYSGICELKRQGGLYLSYAGGCEGNYQETNTAQGWASILTGLWGVDNGVVKHVTLNKSTPTIMKELAEKDVSAAFLAQWQDHFSITYKDEIAVANSGKIPLEYVQYNSDCELYSSLKEHIKGDTECIFGIFEGPDSNGHGTGFELDNYKYTVNITDLDRLTYSLIQDVKARPTYDDEDWLVLVTSDHGGHDRGHGTQLVQDRMTFIATNKKIG